jgi:hypothetical protein
MVEEMSLSSSVYGWVCNATWNMSGHTHPKPSVLLLLELEPQSPEKEPGLTCRSNCVEQANSAQEHPQTLVHLNVHVRTPSQAAGTWWQLLSTKVPPWSGERAKQSSRQRRQMKRGTESTRRAAAAGHICSLRSERAWKLLHSTHNRAPHTRRRPDPSDLRNQAPRE